MNWHVVGVVLAGFAAIGIFVVLSTAMMMILPGLIGEGWTAVVVFSLVGIAMALFMGYMEAG